MASLTGQTIAATYKRLLTIDSDNFTADDAAKYIKDGDAGTASALSLSTTRVGIGTDAPASLLETKRADTGVHWTLDRGGADVATIGASAAGIEIDSVAGQAITLNADNLDVDTKINWDDTLALIVEGSSGNVGIGTATPDAVLEVESTDALLAHFDGGTDPYIKVSGSSSDYAEFKVYNNVDANAGLYINHVHSDGEGPNIHLQTAGSTKLFIQGSSGNVGIGTTAPGHILSVKGGSAGAETIFSVLADDDGAIFKVSKDSQDDGYIQILDGSGNIDVQIATDTSTYFNGGNVGIGTASPQRALHVEGANPYVRISDSSSSGIGNAFAILEFYDRNNSNRLGYIGANSDSDENIAIMNSSSSGDLAFHTANGTAKMTIDGASGNVGIGNPSPDKRLHIIGTGVAVANPEYDEWATVVIQDAEARLELLANDDGHASGIILSAVASENNINQWIIQGHGSGSTPDNTFAIGYLDAQLGGGDAFTLVDNGTGGSNKLTITTAGNVGIGTAAPSYIFHAEDNTDATFVGMFKNASTNTDADCLRLICMVAAGDTHANNRFLSVEDAGGTEWLLKGDGSGEIVIDDTSDRRLKENIIDIPDALGMVNNLKPRRYNRKVTDASWYKYGFIADEFVTVFPNRVKGEVDAMRVNDDGETVPDYQMISVKDLSGVFAKAIQELSAKVTALENA